MALLENNECRFGTIALVTLERAQIDTGGVRLDTGEHHLAPTSLAFRPLDGPKLKKNKLGLRHGLLLNRRERDRSLSHRRLAQGRLSVMHQAATIVPRESGQN